MSSHLPTFVPHTSEEDLGFSGAWRPIFAHSIVDRGIKLVVLGKQTKDDNISGVLMPSFDWSISPFDPAFQSGVAAHMSRQPDPKKSVHFLPNAWATPWKVYTFQGPMNEHFISPANRAMMIGGSPDMDKELLADAFDDIYLFIKRSPKFDKQAKDYYLAKPDMNTDARVPLVERKFFGNFLIRDKERRSDTHVALCFTSAAYNYFIEQMRWATRFGGTPVDSDWSAYLIGDPTKPEGALVWHQEKMTVGGLKMESNVMCFTGQPEQLDPNPERRAISQEHLKNRINFYDPSVWNFPTYQEMVDFALEHWTEVPRDLIADACSHRANVGQRTKKATVVDGGGVPAGGVGAAEPPRSSVAFQDPTPPPQSAPQTPAAPAQVQPTPPNDPELYVVGPATDKAVVKWKESKIREFAASGGLTTEKVHINGDWKTFAEAGYAPAAPPAPSEPAAPPAPAAPEIPAAPAPAAPAAAADEAALQARVLQIVPHFQSFSPEKQTKIRELVAEAIAASGGKADAPVPHDIAQQLGQVMMG